MSLKFAVLFCNSPWSSMVSPITSTLITIAAGGGVGALCRYSLVALGEWVNQTLGEQAGWPAWASILLVNIIGCTLMGMVIGFNSKGQPFLPPWWTPPVQAALVVGFLGSLTTFSTFAADMLRLLQSGQYGILAGYVLASVAGGLGCLILGYRWALSL